MNSRAILIPSFNERLSLTGLLGRLSAEHPAWDTVVIDDGSTDGTSDWLASEGFPHLRLPFNLGIGGAMQAGYRWSRLQGYDYALQFDGDGQHPAEAIDLLHEEMLRTGADLVIGSRFCPAGSYRQDASRMAGIVLLRMMLKMLTGVSVGDPTSGFRLANKHTIDRFANDYPSDYPEVDSLADLLLGGGKVVEVPVEMSRRVHGTTSISPMRSLYYMMKVPFSMFLKYRAFRRREQ